MRKYLGFVAISVFLLSCADVERNNPYDERAYNYIGKSSAESSSSSVEADEPSSSSGNEKPSSSSAGVSSSVETDNNPSSSSVAVSSSSAVPSSSSIAPSSSSVVPSSSSSVPSSSSLGGGFSYGLLPYEGYTYKTVVIGTQTWFAENLNYAPNSGTFISCNNYDCDTYGRLYNWETAKTVCPPGWRLPTKDDWDELSRYVHSTSVCSSCDAKLLKAASGWNDYQGKSGNGTDAYGFSALPGGIGYSDGSFNFVGDCGYWWSASEYGSLNAYIRYMYYNGDYVDRHYNSKSFLYSVRCLQD